MSAPAATAGLGTVSVVIPTYNLARLLPEAIDSALAQTYRDLEIIVVDDGSTDDTAAVAGRYGERIRYIRQENRGASATRNRGIQAAHGQYIAFLDSDDLWVAEKLAEQMPLFQQGPRIGLVYSDMRVVYDDGREVPSFLGRRNQWFSGEVFDEILQSCFMVPSSVVVRRSCLDEVGLFDESLRVAEDWDLWVRLCARWQVALVPKPLATRRERAGSHGSNPRVAQLCAIQMLEKTLRIFPEMTARSRALVRRQLSKFHWLVGYDCFAQRELKEARAHLRRSLLFRWHWEAVPYLAASYLPAAAVEKITAVKRSLS